MEVRFREDHGKARLLHGHAFASTLRQHTHETGHTFREEDITFLDKDKSKTELRVREACHRRTLNASLNGGIAGSASQNRDSIYQSEALIQNGANGSAA